MRATVVGRIANVGHLDGRVCEMRGVLSTQLRKRGFTPRGEREQMQGTVDGPRPFFAQWRLFDDQVRIGAAEAECADAGESLLLATGPGQRPSWDLYRKSRPVDVRIQIFEMQ